MQIKFVQVTALLQREFSVHNMQTRSRKKAYLSCIIKHKSINISGPRYINKCLRAYADSEAPDQPAHPRSLIKTFTVCFFVLRFYGPVIPMGSCRARSVYLTTRLLGRLSPLSG